MGDIEEGGVPDGVVMLSGWVGRGGVLYLLLKEEGCFFELGLLKIGVRYEGVFSVGQVLEECLFFCWMLC